MDFPFPTTPQEAGKGFLVSYISLIKGAGASTLACMNALFAARREDTVLLDLNPESKVRSYMGLTRDVSSSSILDINGIDRPQDIFSVTEKHRSGVFVIPGILNLMDAAHLDSHLHLRAITFAKQSFKAAYAVLGNLSGAGWIAAMLSDIICVVVSPNRADMDAFYEGVEFLKRLGCEGRIKIILNQSGVPGGILEEDIIKFYAPDAVVPYDVKIKKSGNRREFNLSGRYTKIFHDLGVVPVG